MRLALHIVIIIYIPLIVAVATVFLGDFRPEELGSPLSRAMFLAWTADGFACLVLGIVVLRRALGGIYEEYVRREMVLSCIAILIGLPAAYIILELLNKLYWYLK